MGGLDVKLKESFKHIKMGKIHIAPKRRKEPFDEITVS
jgi:hypothetical protein